MRFELILRAVSRALVAPLLLAAAAGCSTKSPVLAYGGDPRPETEVVRFIVPSSLKVIAVNRKDIKVPDLPGGQYEVHTLPGVRELMVAYEEYWGDATSGGIKTTDAYRFQVETRAGDVFRFAHNGPDNPINAGDFDVVNIEIWLDNTKTNKRYAALGAAGYGSFINRGIASLGGGGVTEATSEQDGAEPAATGEQGQGDSGTGSAAGAAAGAAAAGAAAAGGSQDAAATGAAGAGTSGAAADAGTSAAQPAGGSDATGAGAAVVAGGAAVAATAGAGAGADVSGSETLKRLQYWWLLAGQEARRGFLWWAESEAPRISTAHAGAANVAGAEGEPGGHDTLQNLKHWWLRANAQEHAAFRDWIAQPDVVSPASSG